jgi:hypothetical protein
MRHFRRIVHRCTLISTRTSSKAASRNVVSRKQMALFLQNCDSARGLIIRITCKEEYNTGGEHG